MSKFLFFGTIIPTAFLLIGSLLFPNNVIMWFASTSLTYNMVILSMGLLVACLLVFSLFFQKYFHFISGLVAIGLLTWIVMSVYQDSIELLDMLVLIEMTIVCAIAAIERPPEPEFYVSAFEARSLITIYSRQFQPASSTSRQVDLPEALLKKPGLMTRISRHFVPKSVLQSRQMPKAEQT